MAMAMGGGDGDAGPGRVDLRFEVALVSSIFAL